MVLMTGVASREELASVRAVSLLTSSGLDFNTGLTADGPFSSEAAVCF